MKNKQKMLLPTTTVVKGFKTNSLVEPKLCCKSNLFTQVNKAMSALGLFLIVTKDKDREGGSLEIVLIFF